MGRKRWFLIGAAAIAFVVAIVGGAMGRGSFGSLIVVFALAFWIGLPLLVVTGALWAWTRARRRGGKRADAQAWATAVSMAGVLLLIGVGASGVVGLGFCGNDFGEARRFSESMIPRLDRYESEHGVFPEDLEALLQGDEHLPRLRATNEWSYSSNGSWFEFTIWHPDGLLNYATYDSLTNVWREWS
jgi:hypothetical protein